MFKQLSVPQAIRASVAENRAYSGALWSELLGAWVHSSLLRIVLACAIFFVMLLAQQWWGLIKQLESRDRCI